MNPSWSEREQKGPTEPWQRNSRPANGIYQSTVASRWAVIQRKWCLSETICALNSHVFEDEWTFPDGLFNLQTSLDLVQTSKLLEREISVKRAGSEEASHPILFTHVCERDFLLCSRTCWSRVYSEPFLIGYITISANLALKLGEILRCFNTLHRII